ncbi:type II toxin-antitoxin system RelE/ParE family toxin [Stenotrophomonas sp. GD04032]|uniref:type II toxin-antitoxin system RelE/ParE family toxin n=1 Tax=Stenotrophomonas TaxID=40323 RepID=UPI000A6D4E15|nr:type II toxin-antitoxin system RelE/ParE family toxin [Stenotrophomonas sp. GD04032]MCR1819036.1 type II toxin-antitoxin system RelE/ParE family toxin [Stenotrophomonas muris]MDG9975430.1 type II toxin-antitoxin system RelE/ParE family toxin [Stenotrophomonas sp. GD04032]
MKAIEWRPRAEADAADAALWFARQGGLVLGRRFLAELETTLQRIAVFPGSGSTRHADVAAQLPVPLRFMLVPGLNATSSITSIYRAAWTSCVCGALIVVLTH